MTRSPARRLRVLVVSAALIGIALALLMRTHDASPQNTQVPGVPASKTANFEFDAKETGWLAAHPIIRVGAETSYAPYEFVDSRGKFAGVVADYLEIIKQRLGVEFQVFQLLNFAAVQDKLQKRELDVVLAVTRTQERQPFLAFTKPYLHYVNVIVTRDDYGFVSGLRDFAPERVAVVQGHSSQSLMVRAYPNQLVPAYPDILEGLIAVSTGKVDGLVDDIFPIVFNIRQRQISNLKIATPVERALQPQGFSVGVRNDWPELVGILDKVLDAISDEEQRAISQKWLSVRYESKVDYRAIWTSLAVFSVILVAGVLYIRLLSAQRRALMAARAELEAASRAKDQFLANMSHELRTPLHAILGYAELVRERPLADPGRQEALATIARSGRHLLDLINDLLDLSRIRSGRLDLHLSPVPLPALIEEIAAMVRVDAERKGLEFILEASGDLPAQVNADGKRLRQILLNLLGNAIKFTTTGRVTLTVQTFPLGSELVELRVWVHDTGIGIAPEDTARIFAPFEQAEPGRKRESGVGLGLAISQELAHLMGGDIEVESRPNGGSTFRFAMALPLVKEPQAILPAHRRIVGYQGTSQCIVVADDQEENRELLQQILEPLGFEVVAAAGGQAAVAAARRRFPALIVMDLRMPEMSGFQAAHSIRQSPELAKVPIVAASASTADLERAEADSLTFAACLRKPFESMELLDIIGHLLDLTWRYEETETHGSAPMQEQTDAQLVAPSGATLDELLELARLGKLVRVEQIALELERGEARYRAFGRRLYTLARDLDEERLITLLQDCAETHRDVAPN
ncbi:MAG TPA: transporter substrate-binding domain-containing protein [Burkholderiales bacterium]|jgi:signal transduction histidine kinase/CheY-like chemotaxis protein|nr:transporter substrate-binding domain-containing protein [Burkholderiales bacterium]